MADVIKKNPYLDEAKKEHAASDFAAPAWGGIKSYLPESEWMKKLQGWIGAGLQAANEFSPEAMVAASFIGPKGAANLAKRGDTRPQRALDQARETNTRMAATDAPIEGIEAQVRKDTAKVRAEKDPAGPKERNPETGRMKTPPRQESPYGDMVRIPSHHDNPPRYIYPHDPEFPAHDAMNKGYRQNPDYMLEVSDAGPRGLQLNYDQLRRPWYAPWRRPQGTQMGLEGPYVEHPMLAQAYPELKDWRFTIVNNPRRPGGGTNIGKKTVDVTGQPHNEQQHYYNPELSRGEAGSRIDLKSIMAHELAHAIPGGPEGLAGTAAHGHMGGSPGLVALGKEHRSTWGRRGSDPIFGDMGPFAAVLGYKRLAPEWLARRAGDRADWNAELLRKEPFVDPNLVGFEHLPVPKDMKVRDEIPGRRGRPSKQGKERTPEYWELDENQQRQLRRYPGEQGWTIPTTENDIFWHHTVPKWGRRGAIVGGAGGAAYGAKKAADWMESGERAPDLPPEVAETPVAKAVEQELNDAWWQKAGGAARIGINGVLGGIGTFSIPGFWKVPWGLYQGSEALKGYDEMRQGADRQRIMEAQKRDYLGNMQNLDPDTFED